MYKFEKQPDPKNRFDTVTVMHTGPSEVTLDELVQMFEDFISGCGFQPVKLEWQYKEDIKGDE